MGAGGNPAPKQLGRLSAIANLPALSEHHSSHHFHRCLSKQRRRQRDSATGWCVRIRPIARPTFGRAGDQAERDNTISRTVECLRGSQLVVNASLLYPSRHPDCVRKSSPSGFPHGALGHGMISIRERRRDFVVVLVAEPCATHSQNFLSLHGHSPKPPHTLAGSDGSSPADSAAGGTVVKPSGLFPALRTRYSLSLLTQARIPS